MKAGNSQKAFSQIRNIRRETGAVLIVSLIILLVLTVVVLSANREVVIQERSTSAIREANLVFQAAETALRDAEDYIDTEFDSADFNANGFINLTTGLYNRTSVNTPTDYLLDSEWVDGAGAKTLEASSVTGNYSARFFIVDLGEAPVEGSDLSLALNTGTDQISIEPTARVFRIVVRAQGANGVPRRFVSGYYSTEI